ncbi:hypothetical protein ACLS0F_10705 [Avibacterium endocarditidis]|uniref:Uncharacterized protein n=1 Tax=Avibacterium endocarditidis TaxID=380674 RepID=A0ABX4ZUM0_9PAST|nr:hypothetical protein C3Z13_00430 [Avibacterium endocarditidis]
MRRHTLFYINPSQPIDLGTLKQTLSTDVQQQIDTLCECVHHYAGNISKVDVLPYRVTNMGYIKLTIWGDLGQFGLQIIVAGYTEFPNNHTDNSYRRYISVVDSTDAYWLTKVLKRELQANIHLKANTEHDDEHNEITD